jgi:hypothetical protein
MRGKARGLVTEDEIAFIAYLKALRRLRDQGIIREQDPFPEDIGPIEEDDEGHEDESPHG